MIDQMKDALQLAFNEGAFLCPLKGQPHPTVTMEEHRFHCVPCRVRAWLTPGWFLVSDEEAWRRYGRHLPQVRCTEDK